MTVKDTVTRSLLEYPTLHLNSLDVYDHLFCTIGNGYEWVDGELVDIYAPNKPLSIKQAIQLVVDREVKTSRFNDDIEYYIEKKDDEQELALYKKDKNEYLKENIKKNIVLNIKLIKEELSDCIRLIFDIDSRYRDFKPYTSDTKKYKSLKTMRYKRWFAKSDNKPLWEWHTYPCMSLEYSYLCNFPEDIKADWAIAIDRMCWFLDTNLSTITSPKYNENGWQENNILECISKSADLMGKIVSRHLSLEDEWYKLWNKRDKKQSYMHNNNKSNK